MLVGRLSVRRGRDGFLPSAPSDRLQGSSEGRCRTERRAPLVFPWLVAFTIGKSPARSGSLWLLATMTGVLDEWMTDR